MSAGTPLKAVRIPPELGIEIDRTINRRNYNSRDAPWSFTDFCLIAISEKILKMARSGNRPRPEVKRIRRKDTRTACDG